MLFIIVRPGKRPRKRHDVFECRRVQLQSRQPALLQALVGDGGTQQQVQTTLSFHDGQSNRLYDVEVIRKSVQQALRPS